jgi:P27 family predicted phage terminase small subunit
VTKKPRIQLAASPDDAAGDAAPPWVPVCPDYLIGEARAQWDRLVACLAEQNSLSPADGPALELYCRTYVLWRRAQEFVDKALVIHQGEQCRLEVNPYVRIEATMVTKLTTLLSKLGLAHLNPHRLGEGRTRGSIAGTGRTDPLAGLELVG